MQFFHNGWEKMGISAVQTSQQTLTIRMHSTENNKSSLAMD